MTQKYQKSNAPIIQSPDGIRIQISVENKMRFRNAVKKDADLPKLMKSIIEEMVDKTNEGYGEDPSKFGWTYQLPARLAEKCGCTERAVWENLAALEDGKTRKGKVIPERWRIKVKRSGEKRKGGGYNKFNLYWLPAWHEFGAVDRSGNTEPGSGFTKNTEPGTGNTEPERTETLNRTHRNTERGSGDSLRYSLHDALHDPEKDTSPCSHSFGKLVHVSGAHGSFSFVDEANGDDISTSDCMSRRQQFVELSNLYQEHFNKPADQTVWEVFRDNDINFVIAAVNITDAAGPNDSFPDCLSRKLWSDENDHDQPENEVAHDDPPF